MRIVLRFNFEGWDTSARTGKGEYLLIDDTETLALDSSQYLQVQTHLRELKKQLPKNAVEVLAREVIRRVALHENQDLFESPADSKIQELCDALLSRDDSAGARFVEQVRAEGVSIDVVYLEYLGAAANNLGTMWDESRISFVDVTLATSRIYAILRALRYQLAVQQSVQAKSAVFASVPGETHNLGVSMATDLFRQKGWEIDLIIGQSHDELVDQICRSRASIIGLSASGDHSIEALSRLVIALRISNPFANIFVSGSIVQEARETVVLMEPDGMAADMEEAKELMSHFAEAEDEEEARQV